MLSPPSITRCGVTIGIVCSGCLRESIQHGRPHGSNGVAEGHRWVMLGVAMNAVELPDRRGTPNMRITFEQSMFVVNSMAGIMT
jgi:hypothetical protein